MRNGESWTYHHHHHHDSHYWWEYCYNSHNKLCCSSRMMATKYEKYGNSNLFPDLNLKMTRLDEKHALQHIHDRLVFNVLVLLFSCFDKKLFRFLTDVFTNFNCLDSMETFYLEYCTDCWKNYLNRFSNYTSRVNQLTDTNQKLETLLVNSKVGCSFMHGWSF